MISLIAAIQKTDRGLGYRNQLLHRLKDDLKRFRALTTGNVVVMGRKTYESIGKALPDRTNIVITRQDDFKAPEDVLIASSLQEALLKAAVFKKDIFIIGGGNIFNQSLERADRLDLTIIDSDKKADVFFPPYDHFKKIVSEEEKFDDQSGVRYVFQVLER